MRSALTSSGKNRQAKTTSATRNTNRAMNRNATDHSALLYSRR